MSRTTVIYECSECGDRKLLSHKQENTQPSMWCNCEGFVKMEIHYSSDES